MRKNIGFIYCCKRFDLNKKLHTHRNETVGEPQFQHLFVKLTLNKQYKMYCNLPTPKKTP